MSSRPTKCRFPSQTRTSQTRTSQTRTSQTRTSEPDPPRQTLEDDFLKATNSFLKLFENRGPRMEKITEDLYSIAKEVEEIQLEKLTGIVCGVLAGLLGVVASPFSGWVTLAIAAGGGTAITNAYRNSKQGVREILKRVEALRREFLVNMEPLEEQLEEVKTSSQKLEVLAGSSPSESEVVKKIRRRASKALAVMAAVMLVLRAVGFQQTKQPLDDAIVKEAARLDTVMVELENMKQEQQVFRNTPIKTAVRLYIQCQVSGGGASTRCPRYSTKFYPALGGGSQRLISAGEASIINNSMSYSSSPGISSHNVAGLLT